MMKVLLPVAILALIPLCLSVKVFGSNVLDNDAPRPALPQNMFVKVGVWECVPGSICPPTAQGTTQGWYQFDDSGQIIQYREDILYYDANSTGLLLWPYIRTHSGQKNSTAYALERTSESSLSRRTYHKKLY